MKPQVEFAQVQIFCMHFHSWDTVRKCEGQQGEFRKLTLELQNHFYFLMSGVQFNHLKHTSIIKKDNYNPAAGIVIVTNTATLLSPKK